jgi:hypothetical protein
LSDAPSGTAQRDLLNWSNSWMKSIAFERLLFGYFFLAVEEKVTGSKGFESNPQGRGCLTGHKINSSAQQAFVFHVSKS